MRSLNHLYDWEVPEGREARNDVVRIFRAFRFGCSVLCRPQRGALLSQMRVVQCDFLGHDIVNFVVNSSTTFHKKRFHLRLNLWEEDIKV